MPDIKMPEYISGIFIPQPTPQYTP
ncbi:hypothetical protein EAIG_02894 [Escherichia coli B108]|nr:hypothetical protein EAIG_02894 [Escherichia coli B108]